MRLCPIFCSKETRSRRDMSSSRHAALRLLFRDLPLQPLVAKDPEQGVHVVHQSQSHVQQREVVVVGSKGAFQLRSKLIEVSVSGCGKW